MNFTTTSTVGIDTIIKSIQSELYDSLIERWVDDIDGYGRVYKNETEKGIVPMHYISENDYKDVYFDDSKSGQFFFITNDKTSTSDEFMFQNRVKVVFMVDLTKIIGEGRQDELARKDAIEILRNISYNRYTIIDVDKSLDNVFQGLNYDKVRKANINPLHTFSVNLNINYYINDKCD
ncbi:MAG: hypothetical protein AB8G11_09700 [Saprospiraceae bacterium]